MNQRGRKSAAALSIIPAQRAFKPKPPDYLTARQQEEWRQVVASMPNGWFGRETHGLLTAYCRHHSNAKVVAEQIDTLNPNALREAEGLEVYDKLSKILEREQRALSSLATRLRLTPQSLLRAETAATRVANAPTGPMPWEGYD
jgi:phage terminase small subunit